MKRTSLIFIAAFILNYLAVVCINLFFCKPDTYNLGFTLGKLITTIFSLFFGLLAYRLYLKYRGSKIQKEKYVLIPDEKIKRNKLFIYSMAILFIFYNILFIIIPWVSGQTIAMVFLGKFINIFDFNFYFDIYFKVDDWFHDMFPMWKYKTFVELVDKSNLLFNATSSETFHAMCVFVISYFFLSKIIIKEEREKLFSIKR